MAPDKQRPARTRNRSTLSCEACRRRKARCDRKHPCTNCVRWEVDKCVYSTQSVGLKKGDNDDNTREEILASAPAAKIVRHPQHRTVPLRPSAAILPKPTTIPLAPKPAAAALEDDRADTTSGVHIWRTTALASIFISVSSLANASGDDEGHPDVTDNAKNAAPNDQPLFPGLEGTMGPIRGAFYKNRYIGQSHWMYAWPLYPPALVIVGAEMMAQQESWNLLQECKELARVIKSQQPPSSVVLGCTDVGYHLPPKTLADSFLDAYLETFETVYRIFIVPDFRRTFDAIWSRSATDGALPPPPPRREMLIQAQLCMAIGATAVAEGPSLRPYITQWLSEGCAWAAHASQKQKLSVAGLQTLCLLHIAKQTCAVEADLAWIPAGSLVRTAMCMGFHIDPSMLPSITAAEVELRRRLWTTVLELALESSISAGAPPMLSADDVGCCLPSNCNDADLVTNTDIAQPKAVPVVTRPPGVYTDTTAQIALAKSFKTRLGIVRTINQPNVAMATSYKDLVKLSADITAACHQLHADLDLPGTTPFQRKYCAIIVERYHFVIHISYLSLAHHKSAGVAAQYSLSGQICVDMALRMAYTCLTPASDIFKESPLSALMISSAGAPSSTHEESATAIAQRRSDEHLSAIFRRGGGHLRSIPLQCILILALELITRTANSGTRHSSSTSSTDPRPRGDGNSRPSDLAALRAPLSHPPGATGQFDSLRDVELHLMLRVGSEWTARRISEAGDVCCKDHAFVALQLAIAEEQIIAEERSHHGDGEVGEEALVASKGGQGGDDISDADVGACRERNMGPRQRYRAAFQQCRDLMAERLRRNTGSSTSSHLTGEDPCWLRAGTGSDQLRTGAADLDMGLVGDLGPRPVDVGRGGGPHNNSADLFQAGGSDLVPSWPSGLGSSGTACGGGDGFSGFWMGDASDDLDWDGIMDFAAF